MAKVIPDIEIDESWIDSEIQRLRRREAVRRRLTAAEIDDLLKMDPEPPRTFIRSLLAARRTFSGELQRHSTSRIREDYAVLAEAAITCLAEDQILI